MANSLVSRPNARFHAFRCSLRLCCRARNAAGLLDWNYWRGTLKPRPTVDWYLSRIAGEAEWSLE